MGRVFYLMLLTGMLLLAACAPKRVPEAGQQATDSLPPGGPPPPAAGQVPGAGPGGQPASPYATDPQVLARGQALFQANCAACHSFRQKGIGPNLAGLTADVSHEWISRFIRNAPEVISGGDARGRQLFEEYDQYMPPFPDLRDADIQALVSFIHTHKRSPVDTAGTARLGAALPDPIPARISPSGLTLTLQQVLQAPATSRKIPLTRIHQMRVLTGGKKDRHFLQELRGYIYEIENNQLRVFMDIRRERPGFISEPGLATGFGSFAFHPEFYKNGLLYTTHTEAANAAPADFGYADTLRVTLQWVLTEWKLKDPGARTFSGTGRELMRVNMITQMHGVQEITFNPLARSGSPDYGLLYIGIGDGGAAERGAYFICNSNKTVWSSVLRIDPQGRNSKNGQYGIPALNPYAGDQDPNTLGEVFARGFRNPNRISWAPDGKMLISDIGLTKVEELNIGLAGADYGWPAREGTFLLNFKGRMDRVYALPQDDQTFKYTYPVAQFDHDEGNAFSGGFVYQGPDMPLLKGKYVFGDIVSGRVFFVKTDQLKIGQQSPIQELDLSLGGKAITLRQATGSKKTDLRFGLGPRQELYLFTKTDGRIYKVTSCAAGKEL